MPVSVLLANRAALPAVGGDVVPSVTANPTLASDGTPQVGESITQGAGTATGTPTPTPTMTLEVSANGSSGWSTQTATSNWQAADETKYFRTKVVWNNSAGSATAYSSVVGPIAESSDPGVLSVPFQLTAASTKANAPWVFGHVFAEGEVPSGQTIVASGETLQASIRNTWPDGSAKFAQLAGRRNLSTTPATLTLTAGSAPGGSNVALSALQALITDNHNTVDLGTYGVCDLHDAVSATSTYTSGNTGNAKWSNGLVRQITAGPVMSEWLFYTRAPSDTHLAVFWYCQLWSTGELRIVVVVENGWFMVASPTSKAYTAAVKINDTTRYTGSLDQPHHTRWGLPLWFDAAMPEVVPKHSVSYWRRCKVVPPYGLTGPSSDALDAWADSITPLALNDMPAGMGSGGSDPSIGLMPVWDALYLTSGDARAYRSVVANAYSLGCYPLCYRDETTLRPPRPTDYPNRVLASNSGGSSAGQYTPAESGTSPPSWTTSHAPAAGFVAYLVTGDTVHLDQMQLAFARDHFYQTDHSTGSIGPWGRGDEKGIYRAQPGAVAVRVVAWGLRGVSQTLCITPEDDAYQPEVQAVWQHNMDHLYTRFVTGSDGYGFSNALIPVWGLVADYTSGDVCYSEAPWMQHFVQMVLGAAKDMALPQSSTSATRLAAAFEYGAAHVINLLGDGSAGKFNYRDAAHYWMPYLKADSLTPPQFQDDWGDVHADLRRIRGWNTLPAGTSLRDADSNVDAVTGNQADFRSGFWGNLLPAISYCVEHGIAGASAAFNRMAFASNFATLLEAARDHPIWAVLPRSYEFGAPTWLASAQLNKWYELPNTVVTALVGVPDIGGPMRDYSGIALKPDDSTVVAFGGGHSGNTDNAVAGLRLSANTPAWEVLCEATPSGQRLDAGNGPTAVNLWWGDAPNQKPNPPHTYNTAQWCPHYNSVLWFGQFGPYNRGGGVGANEKILRFKWGTKTWAQPGSADDLGGPPPGANATAQDADGNIYMPKSQGQIIYQYTPGSGWSTLVNDAALFYGSFGTLLYDSTRNRLFRFGSYGVGGSPALIALPGGAVTIPTLTGDSGDLALATSVSAQETPTMCYDPHNDRYMLMTGTGGEYLAINAGTFAVTKVNPATVSGTVPNCQGYAAGFRTAFGRLKYVPQLKGVVYCPSDLTNAWFMRLA